MDIQYFGANCVRLSTKKASIIVDDNLAELGQKSVTKNGEIALFTSTQSEPSTNSAAKIALNQPGEYEVSDTSIQGIAARSHMDEEGEHTATIFKVVEDDTRVAIAGHIYPELSDDQLEAIGVVDVLIIPVGGNGYTLDGVGALKLIRKIDPKFVIPTHFEEKGFNFPVPQQSLAEALKGLAMEPKETVAKFKVKTSDLSDTVQLVVLER
jgi:L-ascorbate metabolism protein UlaG (beta-lactamase superfamily)